MGKGILYGVSVGCGDPDDITLKAVKIISACGRVIYPETSDGESAALNIIRKSIDLGGKILTPFRSVMTKDCDVLEKQYSDLSDNTGKILDTGENIAFITIGDVSVYSTFWYLGRIMSERGYEVKSICGVPSFCSAASALNIPLALGAETIHIIPSSYDISGILDLNGTVILMKSGKEIERVADFLRLNGMAAKTYLVQNCGMNNEKIYRALPDYIDKSYFSLFIIRRD